MMAPAPVTPTAALVFDAVAEAADLAESYARAAGEFAQVRDARGLCYSLRCAAAAISAAASAAQTLRPAPQNGGAA